MHNNNWHDIDSEAMTRLERKVDYLIRYLGIDPEQIAMGVMPAGSPAGLPTGDGLPPCLEVILAQQSVLDAGGQTGRGGAAC